MDDVVEVQLNTGTMDEWEELREIAEADGLEVVKVQNLDPFTAIIIVGAIFAVAGAALKWLKRLRDMNADPKSVHGLLIDLRPDVQDPIKRDEDLEYGQIVIITPTSDGKDIKVTVETYDPDNDLTRIGKDIFDKLATAAGKSIESVKDLVEKATGGKGSVKVEETTPAS